MDHSPGELPDATPTTIWVYWDSCGEFMDVTDDPEYGNRWMRDAQEGSGYAAKYELVTVAEEVK